MALERENLSICLQVGQFVYKMGRGPTTNLLVYLCGVRARKFVNLFTRRAICLQDGEGYNTTTTTTGVWWHGGVGKPRFQQSATTHSGTGEKETRQHCGN